MCRQWRRNVQIRRCDRLVYFVLRQSTTYRLRPSWASAHRLGVERLIGSLSGPFWIPSQSTMNNIRAVINLRSTWSGVVNLSVPCTTPLRQWTSKSNRDMPPYLISDFVNTDCVAGLSHDSSDILIIFSQHLLRVVVPQEMVVVSSGMKEFYRYKTTSRKVQRTAITSPRVCDEGLSAENISTKKSTSETSRVLFMCLKRTHGQFRSGRPKHSKHKNSSNSQAVLFMLFME